MAPERRSHCIGCGQAARHWGEQVRGNPCGRASDGTVHGVGLRNAGYARWERRPLVAVVCAVGLGGLLEVRPHCGSHTDNSGPAGPGAILFELTTSHWQLLDRPSDRPPHFYFTSLIYFVVSVPNSVRYLMIIHPHTCFVFLRSYPSGEGDNDERLERCLAR